MHRKKPLSPNALRRAMARADDKLALARERLAALEPGGSPERPIEVASASLVEPRAQSAPCLRCGGPLRIDEHTAESIGGLRLRVVHARCAQCASPRLLYYRVGSALPS